mgnify:CR=1 FL=1
MLAGMKSCVKSFILRAMIFFMSYSKIFKSVWFLKNGLGSYIKSAYPKRHTYT